MSYWDQILQRMDVIALLGLVGQGAFAMRFVVQWIASERAKTSIIPISFWYWSIGGTLLTLGYALMRADPIFILGYTFNTFVYVRNLMLIAAKDKPPATPAAA